MLYQLLLTFVLFQNASDARQLLKAIDPSLGVALPERSYATNCDLTWNNVSEQMDVFVLAHVFGWVAKAIMFRDYWICWVLSIMFEILEYSLQHQLNNFAECWWDHWILDVLVCNWIGLEIGMRICSWFEMKTYGWRGIRQIPSVAGKLQRAVAQFTPMSWTKFEWKFSSDPRHFLMVIVLIALFLLGELNAFYLKTLLWVPPSNILNPLRLLFFFLSGCPAIREAYQYLADPTCKRLGFQAWICIANIITETLICFKFGKNVITEPFPGTVIAFWTVFVSAIVGFAVHRFLLH